MNIKEVKLINEANYKRSKTGKKKKRGRPEMLLRQVVVERPTKIPVFSDPHSRSFSTVVENQEEKSYFAILPAKRVCDFVSGIENDT